MFFEGKKKMLEDDVTSPNIMASTLIRGGDRDETIYSCDIRGPEFVSAQCMQFKRCK
ncbi:hypothetical protein GCM10008915_43940 [Bifidobacterium pullorum subsp. gallinarum]